MNCWEHFYLQNLQQQKTLSDEQKVKDFDPLYTLASFTRRHVMQSDIRHSSVLTIPAHRQHQHRLSPSYTVIQPLCLYFMNPAASVV